MKYIAGWVCVLALVAFVAIFLYVSLGLYA